MTVEQKIMEEVTNVALKLSGGSDETFDVIFKDLCNYLGIELTEMPLEEVNRKPTATTAVGNLKAEIY